ncbi:hypothetical protein [Bacillus toyonensis]|uniref:hypothetical protein n=1 Tax=Bacillus toyonensis TaxID=155322 RepID=UPI003D65D392
MSLIYFTEKEIVKNRQPHKRKTSKIPKENSVERVFERFVDSKVKQNLRPNSLNQFLLMFNSIKIFHGTQNAQIFYMTDITTNFISDWFYWLKNEYVRFDGHIYVHQDTEMGILTMECYIEMGLLEDASLVAEILKETRCCDLLHVIKLFNF